MKKERTILYFDRIDSTNVQAGKEAQSGAESGTVIVADMQTAGRGRRGRTWESPAGINLYFSLILKPEFAIDKASMLTLVMALAVAESIDCVLKRDGKKSVEGASDSAQALRNGAKTGMLNMPAPRIKWPNDIVLNGKKVCGILTEMSVKQGTIEHVIIGVGINVYKQEFSPELVDKATSLEAECGQKISRSGLLEEIMDAFEDYYALFEKKGDLAELRELYNQKLVNLDREVRVLDPKGEFTGIATGINDKGELCVELPDGSTVEVYAGEVSVRGICGYV